MNPCNVLCFLLLSLTITAYIVIAIDSPSLPSSCHPDQRDALLQLKNSFSITEPPPFDFDDTCMNTSDPKTTSWREDKDCCSWEGVMCDNSTGDIVGLDLSCAMLRGAIDSNSSLFSLHHLRSLSLAGNNLIGSTIPPEISVFSWMTYLNLSSSKVSGNVPAEISQLSKLVSLDLSDNIGLEIKNPTMRMLVRNLTRLEDLDLTFVNMDAVIPPFFMNFSSSLIFLHLSSCRLGGKFGEELPNSIGNLTRLTYLDLSGNIFNGGVPNSIGNLTRLTYLDLSLNNFNGVPNSIRNLTRLTYLDLSLNNFNGVPNSIGTLTRLTYLDLSRSHFNGEVPNSIGTLTRLISLDLSRNNFTGGVPNSIDNLTRLTFLDLSWNNFTGGVPNSIGNLTRLTSLDLLWNNFTGHVDFRTFSTLKNLRSLRLSGLSVSGEEQFHWSYPQLQTLDIRYCNLTKFPSFLSQSNKLISLDLRGNMIEEIPNWFWGIGIDTLQILNLGNNLVRGGLRLPWKRLFNLYLQNNSFEGPLPIPPSRYIRELSMSQNRFNGSIPLSICQLTHLEYLQLSQNNLTGVIPQCLSNLTDLWNLDLSSNSLTGPISLPSYAMMSYLVQNNNLTGELSLSLCNATNLSVLDMSNNGLTGTLPQCLKNISESLIYLNLRVNGFQGSIPDIFQEQCSLKSLDLSRNQFDGSLPRSLSSCQSLESLDVGNNKILDSFPDWLGDLPLKVLNLRFNKFHGRVSISEGTRPFSSIRILDISNNGFDGSLPDNLITEKFGLTRMDNGTHTYMGDSSIPYSVMIDLKGVETEMVKINVQFATFDLSSNHFYGEIPRNIGLLKSLKGLNFSHNSFTGTIPPSLGNLINLESLDLSSNHLVGRIPRELAQLTSLGALDLSRNNLTGPIPSGGHLYTFSNSSFEGNPGLCGIPLTRACDHGRSEAQPRLDQRDDREDEAGGGWLEWKFIVMGFGSGMGIGISLGYMVLEMGRPLWLAKIIVRLESGRMKGSKRKAERRNGRR